MITTIRPNIWQKVCGMQFNSPFEHCWEQHKPVYGIKMMCYFYSKLMKELLRKCISNCNIDSTSKFGSSINLTGSTIGRYSYCGNDCQIANAEIGVSCSLSDNLFVGSAVHPNRLLSISSVFQNVRHSRPLIIFTKFNLHVLKNLTIIPHVSGGCGFVWTCGVNLYERRIAA